MTPGASPGLWACPEGSTEQYCLSPFKNKTLSNGQLINNGNLFLIVLEGGKSEI